MLQHLVQNWTVRKPLARSRGGIVATQNRIAGLAGAQILSRGGNAVDAAVATGFALAAVEPWNSGLGGVGFMLVYLAREDRVRVVDFGPVSPRGLSAADYPLAGGGKTTRDLFTWPSVRDDRNMHGPWSIAVPGHVDGLGTALEHFGTLTLAETLQPAIDLAEQGMPVDWYLTLKIATMARELSRYPSTRAVWLPNGYPPVTPQNAPLERLKLPGLAGTLRRLAQHGRRDFYEGALAADIAGDVQALGGVLATEDLKHYRARLADPISFQYRDTQFALAPGLSAGPSMLRVLKGLAQERFRPGGPEAGAFVAYARELREAFTERLASMGEASDSASPTTTTHFNVIDREGNMVAVTQTLLSVFGSRLVLPTTGVLMNNGMFWFDTRPDTANAIGPNKRPLTNMCPVIAHRNGKPWFAIGASGGRRIFPAVLQLSSFLVDHGMQLEDAWHRPRIDASGGDAVGVDPRLPKEVKQALAAHFPTVETELVVYPTNFACPSAVARDPKTGEHLGITDVMSPWSGAVAEFD